MRDRISFLLYRNAITATALADEILRELGLTARAVGILTLVTEGEPMTQRAMGATLGIDKSTMVLLLDDLEAKGLVNRIRHPEDRRAFFIEPTAAGISAQQRPLPCSKNVRRGSWAFSLMTKRTSFETCSV